MAPRKYVHPPMNVVVCAVDQALPPNTHLHSSDYAPYVKFYTDSIEYVDVMEFPAELTHPPYIIHINTRPAFTETVSTTSTLTIHATEDGKCRQVLKGTIRCSIPAIGGYVETYLRDSLQRLYTTYHQLVTKWVENRDALLR